MIQILAIVILSLIIITMLYLYFKTDHLNVKWDKVATFFGFMCFVLMVRHAISGGKSPSLADVDPWQYTLVFWEDLIYSFPILLAMNKWGKNKYTIALAVTLSSLFAMGHMYHGMVGMLVTSVYPYFISYRYSKKTSLGTVMVCHIMYDLMLFYSVRVLA